MNFPFGVQKLGRIHVQAWGINRWTKEYNQSTVLESSFTVNALHT